MIWNRKILFLHTPKTAGMSMTKMLQENLTGKVCITGPYEKTKEENVTFLPGKRHETLVDAESFLIYRNRSISDFEKIFCVIRNPYDLEVSRYAYLRKNLPQDRGKAQDIALSSTFKDYLKEAPFFGMNPPRLHLYLTIHNCIPENLVVMRYEQLDKDIMNFMSPYLKGGFKLPFENSSKRKSHEEMYDAEAEELCFNRHRFFFEKGFYARESFQ